MPNAVQVQPGALSPDAAAEFTGMSRSTWDTYHAAGLVPAALHVGSKVVWCRAELGAWLAHGAPPRDEWARLWPAIRREMLRGRVE